MATLIDLRSALDGSGRSLARFYWLQLHCVSGLLIPGLILASATSVDVRSSRTWDQWDGFATVPVADH